MEDSAKPQGASNHDFKEVVNSVFGADTIGRPRHGKQSNNVTGAIACEEYKTFRTNFTSRLRRLQSIYSGTEDRPHIIRLLNNVNSSNNWQGAFAELTALDFLTYPLSNHASVLRRPPVINSRPTDRLFLGMQPDQENRFPELDGFFADFDVYFDTKALLDSSKDIFDGIHTRIRAWLQAEFPEKRALIVSEFEPDAAPAALSKLVSGIEAELKEAIQENPNITYIQSKEAEGLCHRIQWGPGIVISESAYNPYRHAKEFSFSILENCRQFVVDRPFLLVYVIFPWYNRIVDELVGMNRMFYRSLSRRVFCGLRENSRPLIEVIAYDRRSRNLAQATVKEASASLSGLLFLEDRSITSENSDVTNVVGHLYTNPNATNKLAKTFFWDYAICDLHLSEIDTFEFDNY